MIADRPLQRGKGISLGRSDGQPGGIVTSERQIAVRFPFDAKTKAGGLRKRTHVSGHAPLGHDPIRLIGSYCPGGELELPVERGLRINFGVAGRRREDDL